MKRFTQLLAAFVVASLFLASCATSSDVASSNLIQKRKYRKGFFVASLNKNKKDEKKDRDQAAQETEELPVLAARNLETASLENPSERQPAELGNPLTTLEIFHAPAKSAEQFSGCDIIVLSNGDEIEAKIIEITEDVVRYKKCGRLDGPTYEKNRDDIVLIRYPMDPKTCLTTRKSMNPEKTVGKTM